MKFLLTYSMFPNKKIDCFNLFSTMGHSDDLHDSGPNIQVDSRLHDIGNGTGLCIVDADSSVDLYSWAHNWAGMCDITLKPMLTDHEARLVVQAKTNPKVRLLQKFTEAMNQKVDLPAQKDKDCCVDEKTCSHQHPVTQYCTPAALFNPPGAPPMPIHAMAAMAANIKKAFPEWTSVLLGYKEDKEGNATALTQQQLGPMRGDLAAMGPFPAVTLKEASSRAKTSSNVFPIEEGTFTFNVGGTKIAGGTYDGKIIDAANNPAVSHCGVNPDAWIVDNWNKKGDLSDVGFGLLYSLLGVDLTELQQKGGIE